MIRVDLEMDGLCLFVPGPGALSRPQQPVHVLLPNGTRTPPAYRHKDDTLPYRHDAYLIVKQDDVANHNGTPIVRNAFFDFPIQGVALSFSGLDQIDPGGGTGTPGLRSIANLRDFTKRLSVSDDVDAFLNNPAQKAIWAAEHLAAFFQITGGRVQTVDEQPEIGDWLFGDALNDGAATTPRQRIAIKVVWSAVQRDAEVVTLQLQPFNGGSATQIQFKPDRVVALRLGNNCLDPAFWDDKQYLCDSTQDQVDAGASMIRDIDFNWLYDLVESRPESIRSRLSQSHRKLPVIEAVNHYPSPMAVELLPETAGSETCVPGLIPRP